MLKSMMGESAKKRDPTKQEPFNLTKPKPKVIPEPEAIKWEVQANPIPKAIYWKTLEEIEKEKQDWRK